MLHHSHTFYTNGGNYIFVPGSSVVKNLRAMQKVKEMRVQSLGWGDLLEEGMRTHSSILV